MERLRSEKHLKKKNRETRNLNDHLLLRSTIAAVTRYGVPDRPDLVLMFDANGFIAGVQVKTKEKRN